MKKLTYLSAILLAIAFSACHDSKKAKNFNDKTTLDAQSIKFLTAAHEAGIAEVNAANIAEKNSKNLRVINFAKMMIKDHTAAGVIIDSIAAINFVNLTDTLSLDHKNMLADISKKTGVNFDKSYMQMMVVDHDKAIDLFNEANKNKSASLQNFAGKTLPTLHMHLDSAKVIFASLQ